MSNITGPKDPKGLAPGGASREAYAVARLETSLSTRIGSSFSLDEAPDVVELMLGEKRSPATRREYRKDINKFFMAVATSHRTEIWFWSFSI